MFANSIRARAHSHGHAHDCRHAHARGYYHGHKKYIIGIVHGYSHFTLATSNNTITFSDQLWTTIGNNSCQTPELLKAKWSTQKFYLSFELLHWWQRMIQKSTIAIWCSIMEVHRGVGRWVLGRYVGWLGQVRSSHLSDQMSHISKVTSL